VTCVVCKGVARACDGEFGQFGEEVAGIAKERRSTHQVDRNRRYAPGLDQGVDRSLLCVGEGRHHHGSPPMTGMAGLDLTSDKKPDCARNSSTLMTVGLTGRRTASSTRAQAA